MQFWGKAVGAGLGFMFGGPLGAIVGAAIGHGFDANKEERQHQQVVCPHCQNEIELHGGGPSWICPLCGHEIVYNEVGQDYDRQFLFFVSLSSLAAKMAKADGVVVPEEIHAFDTFVNQELRLSNQEKQQIAKIFNEAKNSAVSVEELARQFRYSIGNQSDVLESMIHLLFRIAMADNHFHPAEERFIHQVANIFSISAATYNRIHALFIVDNNKHYKILGVDPSASDDEVKSAYRKLVREYHPDKLVSKGVPEDFMKFANEKMVQINSAYNAIEKERGLL